MMKKAAVLFLFLLFVPPCFGATPDYSGRNVVELKEHIERRLDDLNKYFERQFVEIEKFNAARFAASERALEVSKTEYDRRFVLLTKYGTDSTEFRSQLSEVKSQVDSMRGIVLGMGNYESNISTIRKDIALIQKQLELETGSQAQWIAWAAVLVFTLINSFLTYILRKASNDKK